MSALAWGRLLRLSLAPSAAADALCGLTLATGAAPALESRTLLVLAGSLGVYHGGLALNDWRDREHDRRTRPQRPIPSGAITPGAALAVAALLIGVGVACAWSAAPLAGAWMAAVAICAVLYDLLGRGPWIGPILLALCRAGNLAVGFVAVGDMDTRATAIGVCTLYGAYVFIASRLGRMEDGEDSEDLGQRPRRLLIGAALCLIGVALLPSYVEALTPSTLARTVAAGVLGWAVVGVAQSALNTPVWSKALVERSMGQLLRRLLVFTAAATMLASPSDADTQVTSGLVLGIALLVGYPLSMALRRVFPPS